MASERITKSVGAETTRAKRYDKKMGKVGRAIGKAVGQLKKGGMDVETRKSDFSRKPSVTTPKEGKETTWAAPTRITRGNRSKSRDTVAAELNRATSKKDVRNAVNPKKRKVEVSGTGREMKKRDGFGSAKASNGRRAYDDYDSVKKAPSAADDWLSGDSSGKPTREAVQSTGNQGKGAVRKKTISAKKFEKNKANVNKNVSKLVTKMRKRVAAGKSPVSDSMRNRAAKRSTGTRTVAQHAAYKAANKAGAKR